MFVSATIYHHMPLGREAHSENEKKETKKRLSPTVVGDAHHCMSAVVWGIIAFHPSIHLSPLDGISQSLLASFAPLLAWKRGRQWLWWKPSAYGPRSLAVGTGWMMESSGGIHQEGDTFPRVHLMGNLMIFISLFYAQV